MAWPNLIYPTDWSNIQQLLRTAANYDFANGQKMTINGTVCGNTANPIGQPYSNTGFVGGIHTFLLHSTYSSQPFDCQWFTEAEGFPPGCSDPKSEPSDQFYVDVAIASNSAKALSPTQSFFGLDTSGGNVTINVVSGLNVINIPPNPFDTSVSSAQAQLLVRGAGDLIINGPSDAIVIFNVGADNQVNAVRGGMDVMNGRSILTTGGVQARNILFNVLAGDVTINAGVIEGSILVRAGSDVKGKADIQGSSVIHGIVIGDGNHSSEFSLAAGAEVCGPFAVTPSIDIEKLVSVDGGATFVDADTPPFPTLDRSLHPNVVFRYTVTNTGTEQLTNIDVTDNVYGDIILNQSLNPGLSFSVDLTVGGLAGEHINTATVTGTGASSGTVVTDSDSAGYVGTEIALAIDLEKFVSPDGGLTWFDADEPLGPIIVSPQAPMFKFVVTNTGTEILDNVSVVDNVLVPPTIVNIPQLLPGDSNTSFRTGTWSPGEHTNVSTATGTGHDSGIQVTDTDPAHWFGVEQVNPSIHIEKLISIDNGSTFIPSGTSPGILIPEGVTPQFKLIVTNGPLPLTNVTVTDLTLGFSQNIPSMLPGEVLEFIVA